MEYKVKVTNKLPYAVTGIDLCATARGALTPAWIDSIGLKTIRPGEELDETIHMPMDIYRKGAGWTFSAVYQFAGTHAVRKDKPK